MTLGQDCGAFTNSHAIAGDMCESAFGQVGLGLVAAVLGLVAAVFFYRHVMQQDAGSEDMKRIAGYVQYVGPRPGPCD